MSDKSLIFFGRFWNNIIDEAWLEKTLMFTRSGKAVVSFLTNTTPQHKTGCASLDVSIAEHKYPRIPKS